MKVLIVNSSKSIEVSYLSLLLYITIIFGLFSISGESKTDLIFSYHLSSSVPNFLYIPGFGLIAYLWMWTAHLILCEVGDIERFPTAKKFSSYIGIVPSVHQSGRINFTGKITKQGNKYLRFKMGIN